MKPNYGKGKNMIKKKLITKNNPKNLYQWHEGAGEYQATCPRCKEELSAPTLTTIKTSFARHYKTKKCQDKY